MMRGLVAALMLAVALSGCVNGSFSQGTDSSGSGQSAQADGTVFFQGTRNAGFADSDPFQCDGDASVSGWVQGQGSVLIEVKDADGTVVSRVDFDGQGQEGIEEDVTGTPGQWSLDVQVRPGANYYPSGFQGQYWFNVYC